MQEKVSGADPSMPRVVVQHDTGLMQVGLGLEMDDSKPRHHFLDQIYGDALTQGEIGRIFIDKMQTEYRYDLGTDPDSTPGEVVDWNVKIGRAILDSVSGSTPTDGLWTWLDRPAVNRLVRLLRNAREKAFGKDE